MLEDYTTYAEANGVLDLPEGYDVHDQISINATMRQLEFYRWQLVLITLLILGLGGFGLSRAIRFWRRR